MKLPDYSSKKWKRAEEELRRQREISDRGLGHFLADAYVKHCSVDGTPERWHHRAAGFLAVLLFWLVLAGGIFVLATGGGIDLAAMVFGLGWGLAVGLELHARRIF